MSEFLFPTDGEWFKEYRTWKWAPTYDTNRWDPDTILLHVSRVFRQHLELSARLDYYAPERVSLVLGALYGKPAPVVHGAVAYAAWMVRQKHHSLTSLTGGEICRGMRRLRAELAISQPVDSGLKDLLYQHGYQSELNLAAGEIVAAWLKATDGGEVPLASWLRERASSA